MSRRYDTPTTEQMRACWATCEGVVDHRQAARADAAFDAWLARVRADAWDEGNEAGQINEHEYRPGRRMTNPYKEA